MLFITSDNTKSKQTVSADSESYLLHHLMNTAFDKYNME